MTTAKLDTTEISVGGGGSKPGKFGVYNASGSQIGFIGVESGNEGAWFKTLSVGGTSYGNGKIKADSSGNVTISDATFTLNLNGITTSINNVFSGSYYAGFIVSSNASPTQQIRIFPAGGVWVEESSSNRCVANGSPAINMIYASSTTVEINGVLGRINVAATTPGYYVNGTQVVGSRKTAISLVTGTAGATYTATETLLINDCKLAINQIIDRLQLHGLIS